MASFRMLLTLSLIFTVATKSMVLALAVKRQEGASCDVFSFPNTYCISSTEVGICVPDNHDGMNPSHWESYTCPDQGETCTYTGGEYGCVGVSDEMYFFTDCQYPS